MKTKAFEEMLRHFPSWSDIRKRKEKSAGGKVLKAIAGEFEDIEKAVEAYRKTFFLFNYNGKEQTVLDYVWCAHMGEQEAEEIMLRKPYLTITTDARIFQEKSNTALLSQGILSVKPEDIGDSDEPSISYSVGGFAYTARLEKQHIWNVFDEFALFTGIERQAGESNEELSKRIYNAYQNRTNSTEKGLTHAIYNTVKDRHTIRLDDILIESIANKKAASLRLDNGDYIIDALERINKDSAHTKEWDTSKWVHDFKKRSFFPHIWDETIRSKRNGVGHNDSLKVLTVNESETGAPINVKIDTYKKSDILIHDFIRRNRVETSLELTLRKYKDTLKPQTVGYKITANKAVDISNEVILVDAYRLRRGENKYHISDLALNKAALSDITIERGKLEAGKKYRVDFQATSPYSTMSIERLSLLRSEGQEESLLKDSGAFKLLPSGVLTNTDVKAHVKKTRDALASENMVDTATGMAIGEGGNEGTLTLDVSNFSNQYLKVKMQTRETTILNTPSMVQFTPEEFAFENGAVVSKKTTGDIIIDGKVTQLTYAIQSGNCLVTETINGVEQPSEIWLEEKEKKLTFKESTHVRVRIQKMANSVPLVLSKASYADYAQDITLSNGQKIIASPMGYVIPKLSSSRTLMHIRTRAKTGFSPTIEYVHIGANLSSALYQSSIVTAKAGDKLDINSNCRATLVELDSAGKELKRTEDYVAKDYYVSQGQAAYVEVDLSSFARIESSTPVIERFSHQGRLANWVRVPLGEDVDVIRIVGEQKFLASRTDVMALLKEGKNKKIYVSQNAKGFIVSEEGVHSHRTIKREDINDAADLYAVTSSMPGIRGVFTSTARSSSEVISNETERPFTHFYLRADSVNHVAHNETRLFSPKASGISIVDMFRPIISEQALMVYTVEWGESETKGEVYFGDADEKRAWSLGRALLSVELNVNPESLDYYDSEKVIFEESFALSNNIELPEIITANGSQLYMGDYIVEVPDGLSLSYNTRLSDDEAYYITEDRFTKLKRSNIVNIVGLTYGDGTPVASKDYHLLKSEGIISWLNPSKEGQAIIVKYRYNVAKHVAFLSIDALYDRIGYNVEAYALSDTMTYEKALDGMELLPGHVNKIDQSDRVSATTNHPNYRATVGEGKIYLTKIASKSEGVFIKQGWHYDQDEEHYMFANEHVEKSDRLESIDFINTTRRGDTVHFIYQSKNYLPGSSMRARRMAGTSYLQLKQSEIKGVSTNPNLASTEAYNRWETFDSKIAIEKNGGFYFEPLSARGYAMAKINSCSETKTVRLSAKVDEDITILIAEQRPERLTHINKLVFAREIAQGEKKEGFASALWEQKKGHHYFLVIQGRGRIEDIIISDDTDTPIKEKHKKALASVGFEVKEKSKSARTHLLRIDSWSSKKEGVDVDKDGTIKTGMSSDWGYTPFAVYDEWSKMSIRELDVMPGGYLEAKKKEGYVETPAFYVKNVASLRSLIVKANRFIPSGRENLAIEVYTSKTREGTFTRVSEKAFSHSAEIRGEVMSNYAKVRVVLLKGSVLTHLSIYGEMYENSTQALKVGQRSSGELTTKVFDLGEEKKRRISKIGVASVTQGDSIDLLVRGMRQDANSQVWSPWRKIPVPSSGETNTAATIDAYRFIQFKVSIKHEDASINIQSIQVEEEGVT